jgi:hypothetical protein
MATAYWESSRPDADESDDFDEYDPTPYGGGYDLFITYGRPLPPTEETCYPCSEPSTSYEAPHYSASETSPYGHHAKPQPAYGFRPQQEQQPSYGGGYGSRPEPAAEEEGGGYGSGYGRKQKQPEEEESYGSGYGSGYGRKPQAEESYGSGGYSSGYAGQTRPEEGYGSAGYGSGYGNRPQQVEESYGSKYGSGYGRKPQVEESYGSGYGIRPQGGEEYGSGGGYGSTGHGYGRKTEEEGYGGLGYGYGKKPTEEGEGVYASGGYQKPYGEETQGSYGYGNQSGERRSYGGGEQYQGSYGRKKHVSVFPFELFCVNMFLLAFLCLRML